MATEAQVSFSWGVYVLLHTNGNELVKLCGNWEEDGTDEVDDELPSCVAVGEESGEFERIVEAVK